MRMYDIIERKRDGFELSQDEIIFFVNGYVAGNIPDYQVSALLMAIYFKGMTIEESAALTLSIVETGQTVDLSMIDGIKVDKHSTGGVGDTTTLILAPLVASAGLSVAKMSGRGLGHTGGTLDKLEAIPGFNIEITNDKFINLVNESKVAVIGQSNDLAPADKLLYSLRDVTATVDSIPLIASSIMSKKIASGADKIVLDVKTGAGAFMEKIEDAKLLAKTMVEIGNKVGKQTVAIISNMEQPLGNAIGNSLEIEEAINTLKGCGPKDLTELCLDLGSQMVFLAEKAPSLEIARDILVSNIENGSALEKFKEFIENQNGDATIIDHPEKLTLANYLIEYKAEKSGYIHRLIANDIGKAAMLLGAGRETKESVIDLSVGLVLNKKVGDYVNKGESIITIHANSEMIQNVTDLLDASIIISDSKTELPVLIYETIY